MISLSWLSGYCWTVVTNNQFNCNLIYKYKLSVELTVQQTLSQISFQKSRCRFKWWAMSKPEAKVVRKIPLRWYEERMFSICEKELWTVFMIKAGTQQVCNIHVRSSIEKGVLRNVKTLAYPCWTSRSCIKGARVRTLQVENKLPSFNNLLLQG